MSYTRDWVNTTPLDHSKFKDQPGNVRAAKIDVEERLAAFIYGFTSGETESGFKYAPFIVQGTAPSSAVNQIIAHGSDVNSVCELFVVDEAGNRMQLTSAGKMYLAGGGKLPNNTYLVAVDSTGTGLVNLLRCTTGNVLELPQGVMLSGSTAPTTDLQIPGKKYVDETIASSISAAVGGYATIAKSGLQTTSSTTFVQADFGTTDYIEITDPSADDKFLAFFTGTCSAYDNNYPQEYTIMDNSSGSYAKSITDAIVQVRLSGDGVAGSNMWMPMAVAAVITGKSSTFRISGGFRTTNAASQAYLYHAQLNVIKI